MNKFLEAGLEGIESVIDSLTENEFLKNVPIVGTAVKLMEGAISIRDRIFLLKIKKFISEMEKIPVEMINEFKESLSEDGLKEVGESAFLVLDKLNDLKKAELLGFYFVCYLQNKIDVQQFKRIAIAIDNAFVDDLEVFLSENELPQNSQNDYMKNLLISGVVNMSGGKQYGNLGDFFFSPSSIGALMFKLWKEK